MPYLVIALMLIGPWAQAAEPMTAEDAAIRFCEAYNSRGESYCEYEEPFFGQSSVDLYFPPARGFTMGHVVDALSGDMVCSLMIEGFAQYEPPIGQEIKTLRNNGWALRLFAVQNDVSKLVNTCEW